MIKQYKNKEYFMISFENNKLNNLALHRDLYKFSTGNAGNYIK